jgi:hypothetical protein
VILPGDAVFLPPDAAIDTTDDVTEPTDDVTEPTDDAIELTDAVTEPTDAVIEPTDAVNEATDAANEATDAVIEATDAVTEATDAVTEATDFPTLAMPPGWEKMEGWAAEAPHLPSWWDEGKRPEEDKDELLFRADINFFFGEALEGTDQEERDLKKDLFFRAERNFFFAQGIEEREEEEEGWLPEEPMEAIQKKKDEPKEVEPSPSAARERDHKRQMAATALSYEEKFVPGTPPGGLNPGTPRQLGRTPSSIKPVPPPSGDGAASLHWWENNSSTPRRPKVVNYPPDFGDVNI